MLKIIIIIIGLILLFKKDKDSNKNSNNNYPNNNINNKQNKNDYNYTIQNQRNYNDNNELEKENNYEDYKKELAQQKGYEGEMRIAIELKKISSCKDCRVLRNVYIPTRNGKTSEIDLILISPNGIFVIESKNYTGIIYGSSEDYRWTCVARSRKHYQLYNPKKQNATHIKHLKDFLDFPDDKFYKSYIVFSDECNLRLKGENDNVLYLSNLVQNILMHEEILLTSSKIETIYERLFPYAGFNTSNETKNNHIKQVQKRKNR